MTKLITAYELIIASKLRSSILIGIVCIATFGNTLLNDYNLDDHLVTQNHRLTSKGIKAIPEIYRSPYYQDDMGYSYGYRPTTLASFAIEHELFGDSAFVSHSINLALYLLTCILVFLLIVILFPDKTTTALGTALLFTVHPIHTEVVASIKNRDELLSLLFMLGAMFIFVKTRSQINWIKNLWLVIIGILLVGLSISSKLSSASMILIIPILVSKSINPLIRIGGYSLINLILMRIIYERSGVFNFYYLAPIVLMFLADAIIVFRWKHWSKTWNNSINHLIRIAGDYAKITGRSTRRLHDVLILKLISQIRTTKSLLLLFFSQVMKKFNLKNQIGKIYNWVDTSSLSIKTPLVLSFVFLLGERQYLSIFLTIIFIIIANIFFKKHRIIFAHFIMLSIVAFSEIDIITPLLFPFLFYNQYFEKNKTNQSQWLSISYVLTGLSLIFTDVFLIQPAPDGYVINITLFIFYSISVISSWIFVNQVSISGIRFLVAQGVVAFISVFIISTSFNTTFEDVFFSQVHSFILLIQITISFFIKKLRSKSFRFGNHVISSGKILVGMVVISILLFNLVNYTIQREDFLANAIHETSTEVDREKSKLKAWITLYFQNASSHYLAKKNVLSKSVNEFQVNSIQPLLNSTITFKFDSSYVANAINLNREERKKSDQGRPFDFIENPIPASSNQFLRYGFYLSSTARYLLNLIIPLDIAYYYGFNEVWVSNFLEPTSIFIMLIFVALGIFVVVFVKKQEYFIGYSILFTLLCLLPFSGVLEPLPGTYSPRFAYVSSFFFCCFVVGIGSRFFIGEKENLRKFNVLLLSFGVLVICSGFSIKRNALWKNKLTLMQHDIKNVANSAQAHNLLAHAIMEDVFKDDIASEVELRNQVVEASIHFRTATEIYPSFFNAFVDLGKVQSLLGNQKEAIAAFKKALEIDSSFSPIVLNIATLSEQIGDFEQAIIYYNYYLSFNSTNWETYELLARLLFNQGRLEESIIICERYLKIDSTRTEFHENIEMMRKLLDSQNGADSIQ